MAYTLQNSKADLSGVTNILASANYEYVHGGATMDGSKFPAGLVKLGTLVARNTTSGKYEPFSTTEGYDNFYILDEDHKHDGSTDFICGMVLIAGSVYEAKLPVKPSDEFKEKTPNIFYVTHI